MRKRNLAGLPRHMGLVELDILAVVDSRAAEERNRIEDTLPAEVVVRDKVVVSQTCFSLRLV